MSVASALVTGPEAAPRLAEAAVRQAMEKAAVDQVGGVILFLTPDFSRQAAAAVLAAARAAGSLQVFGMAAPGLMTEAGWILDQPAAAALVLGAPLALAPGGRDPAAPRLVLDARPCPLADGRKEAPRFGLGHQGSPLWQGGRLAAGGTIETAVLGARCRLALSTGLKVLGAAQAIDAVRGREVLRVGGLPVLESLTRLLPPEIRRRAPLPLHLLGAVRAGGCAPAIPILAANADGSLTLAECLASGESIAWVLRQPLAAEADMGQSLEAAACRDPAFALMFSCIGRGPLFYGDDDRDLAAFRQRFPTVPLLGAYGSSQIAPGDRGNRQWQNCVVTALFETEHVQSLP